MSGSEIHQAAPGIFREAFQLATSVSTPVETRGTNNAVDRFGSCDPMDIVSTRRFQRGCRRDIRAHNHANEVTGGPGLLTCED